MFTLMKIAWRNVWRNPQRSGIVVTSMAVGLWGMLFSFGFFKGSMDQALDTLIGGYLGHMQIHNRTYPARGEGFMYNNFIIGDPIADEPSVEQALADRNGVTGWAPRLKTTGFVTSAGKARGIYLVGIVPEKEATVNSVGRSVITGRYLETGDRNGILIGKELAKKLEVNVGSKVVVTTQDVNNEKAVNAFTLTGIFQTPHRMSDLIFVYVNLETLQTLAQAPGQINEIAVHVGRPEKELETIAADLLTKIGTNNDLLTWKQIFPAIIGRLEVMTTSIFIAFFLIFSAMAFGIANAVLMAVFERIRELGVMRALGTTPSEILITVIFECIFLSMIGIAAGTSLGWLTVYFFGVVGIDLSAFSEFLASTGVEATIYPKMDERYLVLGPITIFGLATLAALWPAFKASKIAPVEAMKHL